MRASAPRVSCVPFALSLAMACADCDREGCEALSRPAPGEGTGIAGVVAASSDVVDNGCSECPLGQATLAIWRTDALVTTGDEASAVLAQRDADVEASIDGRFDRSMDPGAYLLCVRPSCIGVSIGAGETLTVNVKLRNGPTSFFVRHSADARLEEDFGFDVGF